jgi:peroxiredoxin Q/BCP
MAQKLKTGDQMVDFTLKDSEGEETTIKANDGKTKVIFFYPKDNTRKCTEEACSFRDWYDHFLDLGVEVIGISSDSVNSHQKFKSKHHLNFKILSDPNGRLRKLFGATMFFNLLPQRSTFVVDGKGKILHRFDSLFDAEEHVEMALNEVKK